MPVTIAAVGEAMLRVAGEVCDGVRLHPLCSRRYLEEVALPSIEAGMAKMYASEVALKCALESMRIHGGYGYSAEFVVERLYRDAPLMAIGEGTNDIQRLVIARSLVSGAGRLGW